MSFFVKINSFSNIFDLNRKYYLVLKENKKNFVDSQIRRFGIHENISQTCETYQNQTNGHQDTHIHDLLWTPSKNKYNLHQIMSSSCHLDRASNDEFSVECLF